MKISKLFSGIFGLLGAALLAVTVLVSVNALDDAPVLVEAPEAALTQSEAMMEALAQGDFSGAAARMQGQPQLGVDREPADEVGKMIWSAFVDSIRYEFTGECYATDSGIARNVTIETLDISSVTASLRQRSQTLLNQRVAQAEDVEQIYDENGDYREDFVMEVLHDAAREALKEDAVSVSKEITLNLVYQQGQWWVVPDQALLAAISGAIAG